MTTTQTLLLPPPVSFSDTRAQDNAKYLCDRLARLMGEADEAVFDYDYEDRVEEIESEPRSGFWPWTSGGYHVVLPAALSHHWGTGNAPAPIQPLLDAGDQFIQEAWAERYPERPTLLDCILADEGTPAAEFRDEAETWESEGWSADTDCYFWKARVMFLDQADMSYRPEEIGDVDEPYVAVDAYINTDLNYGRDNIRWLSCYGSNPDQTHGNWKRIVPLRVFEALSEADLDAIAAEAVEALP